MSIEWIKREDEQPHEERVVGYSPNLTDPALKYRIMSAWFFNKAAHDCTHWARLSPPEEDK